MDAAVTIASGFRNVYLDAVEPVAEGAPATAGAGATSGRAAPGKRP
jgi:hypothetical protein